ncbi:hypothetical protein KIW84_043909 [Lathyrus oleraceus]|uniref:Uncharacterized protein n=1 Tax=Pisum sativum TaxID=3888 RepID=A0A9D4XF69_PEA|nr:hypothetical protein KIW84_043909 [Pisum sativum]
MTLRIYNHATLTNLNVVNLDSVDDNILNKLNGESSSIGNVNINSSTINCLVACHDKLLLECDQHAASEYDPKGTVTCDCMTESAGFWIQQFVIGRISDNIDWTAFTSAGVSAKSLDTVC